MSPVSEDPYLGGSMTKEENRKLAEEIRTIIKQLRAKGYTYKIFYTVVNYSPTNWYNFMRNYNMSDDDLLALKKFIEKEYRIKIERW